MSPQSLETNVRLGKLDPRRVSLIVKVDARELNVRLAVGLRLIRLGCWIIGLGVEVTTK